MKKILLVLFFVAIIIQHALAQKANTTLQKLNNKLTQQSIHFTENKGQIVDINGKLRPDILFTAHGNGVKLFVTNDGIYYQFSRAFEKKKDVKDKIQSKFDMPEADSTQFYRLDMKLFGANKPTQIIKDGVGSDYENFYLAHCPKGVLGVKNYNRITFKNIYPNIDWVLYSKDGVMEYDFVAGAGANLNDIKMKYDGAVTMNLDEEGSLKVSTPLGTIQEHAPVSLENNSEIKTAFVVKDNVVAFAVKDWDGQSELRIDPSIVWATYYGGTNSDGGVSCTTDASGNVYLTGNTSSTTSIASAGFQNTLGGATDAFLVKFSDVGTRLWATYYGGTGFDLGQSCATDNSGNIYLAGKTESTSGIAFGGFQNSYKGNYDGFLVKFSDVGTRLWATYYGGTGLEDNFSCVTDHSNNVYMSGVTYSTSGITSGGFQNTFGGTDDAFLVKFSKSGARLWATYYGGTSYEAGNSCAVDNSNNVYLTGSSLSTTGIASGGFQNINGGYNDAFLVKFSDVGTRLWATYYGGTGSDYGYSCIIDNSGNVYVAGETLSPNNIAFGGFQNTYKYYDAFLVKFTGSGARLWGTYYGGTNEDYGESCTTDSLGNIYLAGRTNSAADIASGGFQNTIGSTGYFDAFLVKFTSGGARIWGTYYGGTNYDYGWSCVTKGSNVYLAGVTASTTGIAIGGFQNIYGGNNDAFLAKISEVNSCSDSICPVPTNLYTNHIKAGTAIIHWDSVECATSYGYRYTRPGKKFWIFSSTTNTNSAQLISLQSCDSVYEWTVRANCKKGVHSDWAPTIRFIARCGTFSNFIIQKNSIITAYPNPFNKILTITSNQNKNENVRINIYDNVGKLIKTLNTVDNHTKIDLSQFHSGVYFADMISAKGKETIKLIKQ